MPKNALDNPKIPSQNLFPVVGIGASAGGLDAFKKLIQAIPNNSGMAYILVQHLHPEYDSALPEILQRVTKIPVVEISDNVHVNPDHIYVIPSNKMLVATDGILKLSPRSTKDRVNMPIDIFFSSLAEVHQGHSIGVVLSGTGADGTAGLKDIKDQGGLTFAQDVGSAAYDGMPQHAIDADVVDFILPPEKIPEKLMSLKQSYNISSPGDDHIQDDNTTEDTFRQIIALLRVRVGVDFSFYKQTTVRRRIIRRMVMLHQETISEYLDYLKKNKPELDILFQDLLIPVTSFFRDKLTFDNLCDTVFPEILKNKSYNNPLRIWVAGCSTGQEAYSIAMCCHESLSDHNSNIKVQIFASDISEKAIKKARNGIYSKKEVDEITDSRLHHFFNKTNGNYQVKKPIRDMCIFATHNFLKDPPFAKMDLMVCRNVLIYFEPFLQKKALGMFHYALNDKGVLWLGKSETTGNSSDLFIPFGKNDKFYTRKSVPGRFTTMANERNELAFADKNYFLRGKEIKADDFQKNADDILLLKYTPVGVVVNEQFEIVQFRGSTGEYLEPSPGKASLNVLKMAKDGLAFEIRNALHKAKSTSEPFVKENIAFSNAKKWVTIEVIPLLNTLDLHFLILFRNTTFADSDKPLSITKAKGISAKNKKDEKDIRIYQLEKELARAREDMSSIAEDQEAANEELQSANEELLSGSEELQSLNEELETSKEELQSTNEELITVNQELYDRNEELDQSRKLAEASISILHEPLLALDKNFIIKSANQSFYKTFQLTEDETLGKVIFQLQDNGWDIPGLRKELVKIHREKERLIEVEITFTFPVIGERIICFNIHPVIKESGEQLILLALDDITARNQAAQILEEKANDVLKERQVLHNFFIQTPAMLAILKGPEYVFELANPLYRQFIGNRNPVGQKLIEALPELEGQGFIEILDTVYKTGEPFTGTEMPAIIEKSKGKPEQVFLNVNFQAFNDTKGDTEGILVFAYDVTTQVTARKQLELHGEMMNQLYMNAPSFICILRGPKYVYELVNPEYQKLFGKRKLIGKTIIHALPELQKTGILELLDNVYKTGVPYVATEMLLNMSRDQGKAPETMYFNFSYQPLYDLNRAIDGILVFGYEVTKQVLAKKQGEDDLRLILESIPQITITASADGDFTFFNQYFLEYSGWTFEEAIAGKGWKDIIHPEDMKEVIKKGRYSLATAEDFHNEINLKRKSDGMYRCHIVRITAIKDNLGKVMSWAGSAADIHDQKLFAEELKKQIEERIKLEDQKNHFISMASHELKTPVTSIKGYAQFLQQKFKKEGNTLAEGYLIKMDRQINKITTLINDLLDATKVTTGQLQYNEKPFDFNELVTEIVEDMQQTSKSHMINLSLDTSQMIFADRNRVGQVMTNMLSNAIKYSPRADHIIVNTKNKNHTITFCVQDFGIGVNKENQPKVFKQFFRVSGTVQDTFPGLGLGLFISSEIIKRYKGTFSVVSVEGKGSTFCFTLPVQKDVKL